MRALKVIAGISFLIFLSSWFIRQDDDITILGERLFNDPILSSDSSISCASCHIAEFAFSDTVPLSKGVEGRIGLRNTPSAMNQKFRSTFFWDGKASTLAEQAIFPIENPLEMNLPIEEAVKRLKDNPSYSRSFKTIFGKEPDAESIGLALSAFQETLETSNSPFDRWMNDEPNGMSEAAVRGRELFMNEALCFDCHSGPDFTNDDFRNIGLFNGKDLNDSGRAAISKNPDDLGKFKVPGLRNVAVTGPYMHNGMFETLKEVVNYYNHPTNIVPDPQNADSLVKKPLNLTPEQEDDLVEFMKALTDDRFSHLIQKN